MTPKRMRATLRAVVTGCYTRPKSLAVACSIRLRTYAGRCWTQLGYLCRAVGLRSVNFLPRGGDETAKPVLQRSFWIALSRCAVHLIPMLVFCWLLILSYKIVYFGPGFSVGDRYDAFYLALFQIAAKIQELLCLASLSTVLLDLLRHELLSGSGVTLGLLPSHLWFSQASYVISPEFLTAIHQCFLDGWHCIGKRSKLKDKIVLRRRFWANFRLVLLLSIFIPMAVLIGPFTAVLMIPKIQYYPAGGTQYALEASAEQLWPNVVNADAELEVCFWPNATAYAICPSGGYSSFSVRKGYKALYDSRTFTPSLADDESSEYNLGTNFAVMEPLQILPAVLSSGNFRESFWKGTPTHMVQPHMYTALRLQMLLRDWRSAADSSARDGSFLSSRAQYVHSDSPRTRSDTTYPYTHVRCTAVQNLTQNASSALFVQMAPSRDGTLSWALYPDEAVPADISSIVREPLDHVRTQWLELPAQDFGSDNVSIGLLLELPWSRETNSRAAVGCTVQSLWAPGTISRTQAGNWYVESLSSLGTPAVRTDLSPNDPMTRKFCRLIDLRLDWLALLTPLVPDGPETNDSWTPNTLERVFYDAGFDSLTQKLRTEPQFLFDNGTCFFGMLDPASSDHDLWNTVMCAQSGTRRVAFVERTVARMVSDGLSRRYSHIPFQMQPSPQNWQDRGVPREEDYSARLLQGDSKRNAILLPENSPYVVQSADFAVYGYGYMASTWSDKMALAIISIYLLFSTSHVVWTLLFSRVTSSSWDTALELLLLGWNSLPATPLRGTSAHIGRWDTYRRIAKVRAQEQGDPNSATGPDELALRLVLEQDCASTGSQSQASSASASSSVPGSPTVQQAASTVSRLRFVETDKKYI